MIAVLLLLIATTAQASPIKLTPDQLVRGAAMIRSKGFECERITRVIGGGNRPLQARVDCGRHSYTVTISPTGYTIRKRNDRSSLRRAALL